MKSICCVIWILGAVLILFTFDSIPHRLVTVPSACHSHAAGLYSVTADGAVTPVTGLARVHVLLPASDAERASSYLCPSVALDLAANLSPPSSKNPSDTSSVDARSTGNEIRGNSEDIRSDQRLGKDSQG
jgi:hypothetical protein